MSQHAFLFIADISGYTQFVTQTEAEHGEGVLNDLLHALVEKTKPPLILCELEGDAVFSYAPAGSFKRGQTLVELIENMYAAFAATKESIRLNTTCSCRACANVPQLDLKFVVHYGAYSRRTIGSLSGISGSDVILVHRLLKNSIRENTGIGTYSFFTESVDAALPFKELKSTMQAHSETYDHLGKVDGFVYNLQDYWHEAREAYFHAVEKNAAWFTFHMHLPVPPSIAWDIINSPHMKQEWLEADSVLSYPKEKGRIGVGAENHCAHGSAVYVQRIIAWEPFEHVSEEAALPFKGKLRDTKTFTAHGAGTWVDWLVSKPFGGSAVHSLFVRLLIGLMKPLFRKRFGQGMAHIMAIAERLRAELPELQVEHASGAADPPSKQADNTASDAATPSIRT